MAFDIGGRFGVGDGESRTLAGERLCPDGDGRGGEGGRLLDMGAIKGIGVLAGLGVGSGIREGKWRMDGDIGGGSTEIPPILDEGAGGKEGMCDGGEGRRLSCSRSSSSSIDGNWDANSDAVGICIDEGPGDVDARL
jgi:hypothetical protein